jgi:hypothetical protein
MSSPTTLLATTLLLVALSAPADAGRPLDDLLEHMAEQSRLLVPLRADGTMESDAGGKTTDRVAILTRNRQGGGVETLMGLEKAGVRALVGGPTEAKLATGGKVRDASYETKIGETGFTVEDLLPFDAKRCMGIHIVDDRPDVMAIRCDPGKDSKTQYSLTVWKIDRAKGVPIQVLYYRDTMSNLVKMLRLEEHVSVGNKWRPQRLVMQDYKLRSKDVVTLTWQQDPKFPPELFDPKSLGDGALLTFPK